MVKIGDEGQAMESLGTGMRGGLLSSLQEGRVCRRNGGGSFNYLLFTYFIMDRDEAIARGLRVHETRHSMKRRSPWHDYHGRGTYMLTLVVEGRMPLLGKLWGRVDARPGDGDAPKVMLSELGIAIAKEEIPKIHKYYPQVEVWRVCIMPDHIHLIVRVKEDLRGDKRWNRLERRLEGDRLRLWLERLTWLKPKGLTRLWLERLTRLRLERMRRARLG
ncbi:hypothetical protein RJT11_08165 [Segatella copri]|uniref:hypothetical protein n=1 Tax=Segatella copri TaxID=165179 RepID=UPI00294B4791|nr:hypothetical protein [Segatella copri]WOG05471.1 hypothetical protein RJT11_08165 [Segatella copri]